MTAVVRFNVENRFPWVIGDLLVSHPRKHMMATRLPTFQDTTPLFPKDAENFPSGLQQKVAVIGEKLAIGWSGRYSDAKDVITHLYYADQNGTLRMDYLDHYLKSLGDQGPGFIGFLLDGNGGYHHFGYRCTYLETKEFGQVGFLGTGSDDVESLLGQVARIGSMQHLDASGKAVSTGNTSVVLALMLSGNLLLMELVSGKSLQNCFGGGYELAYLTPGGFRKLDGVTYAFWTARVVSENEIHISRTPLHAFAYGYTDDILTIRSLSLDIREDRIHARHWYDHVGPLYRPVVDAELKNLKLPELNNKLLCNHFFVQGDTGLNYCRVDCRASTLESCLLFEEVPEGIRVAVQDDFLKLVGGQIREAARR